MKIKIVYFILVLIIIIGCNNKNSKIVSLQKIGKDSMKVEDIASSKNIFGLIDSIKGPKNEWCYILGKRINDSIYSSIRILSQKKDTLYFIDKDMLKNTKGIDVRAEFSAFKIFSNNRKELIINGVDSLFHAYGDDAIITWNSSKDVFETVKY